MTRLRSISLISSPTNSSLLIRLALREFQTWELLGEFVYYYFTLSLLAILFTFVYFNYFEFDLVWSIRERYDGPASSDTLTTIHWMVICDLSFWVFGTTPP